MAKTQNVLMVSTIMAGLFISLTEPSWACSCIGQSSPSQALFNSAAVFEGYVINISLGSRWVPPGISRSATCGLRIARESEGLALCLDDNVVITIEVTAAWKGVEPGLVQIQTPAQGSACGYPFRVGQRYMVYANRTGKDSNLGTSICDSTKLRSDAKADLKELGPPVQDKFSEQGQNEGSRN